jgi:chemotaxis protein MotB
LSADRANAARRILNINGVNDTLFKQIRGLADRELRDPANPFAASNRRVTITMLYPVTGDSLEAAPGAAADSTATSALVKT